jgi:hypothetical protein
MYNARESCGKKRLDNAPQCTNIPVLAEWKRNRQHVQEEKALEQNAR